MAPEPLQQPADHLTESPAQLASVPALSAPQATVQATAQVPALVPLPGTPQYALLQNHILKEVLSSAPDPTPSTRLAFPSEELSALWTREIINGEEQIRVLGHRVHLSVIQHTVKLKFMKVWNYWRAFRLHDLPPEIINHIFRLVVWSVGRPAEAVKQRLWLTWVCRTWRAFALSDTTLWNAIWFRDPPPYTRSLEWFNRAGTARIDIRLDERDPQWDKNEDQHRFTAKQMSDLLDKLFVKLSQIRMLVVIVDNWPPAITVLRKLQDAGNAGIPITMERLEIYRTGRPLVWIGPGFDKDGYHEPPILNGGQTRTLSHLSLSGVHIDWNKTPLQNLTTLDLRHMPMSDAPSLARFREILQECSMLKKLSLDGSGPYPVEKPFDHSAVDLPHLKALVLGSFNVTYACFIVSQFNAPGLLDLTLLGLTGSDYTPFITLLMPKFKRVRLLTLYNVHMETTARGKIAMVRWFDSMSDLAYARIAQLKPSVLKLLLEDPDKHRRPGEHSTYHRRVLCPKLKTLEVQVMPYMAIAEFCRRRKEMDVPINKIYLNPPIQPLDASTLRVLRSVTSVCVAPTGTNTTEENELLDA
ncbi:hypothetical protein ID866_4550 [Astraeus odoratus]|nr:hypothetical protein ID866_4550 [Astraeus odoratus]